MSPPSKPKITTTTADEELNRRQKQLEALDKRIQAEYERYLDDWGWEIPKHEEEAIRRIREETIKMMYLPAMQTLRTATINEIVPSLSSPQKLMSMNKGLIHLLQIIDKAPNSQIPTRRLLDIINSRDLHKLIKKGEELGFIKREKVPKPKGQKGNNITINSLTKEGHDLLEAADKLQNMY